MSKKLRSKTALSPIEETEAIFTKLPNAVMMQKMRETTLTWFEQLEMDGKVLADIKDKANIPCKIACKLQDLKVDGWVGMKWYHMKGSEYKLFHSLQDLVRRELKQKLTPKKD